MRETEAIGETWLRNREKWLSGQQGTAVTAPASQPAEPQYNRVMVPARLVDRLHTNPALMASHTR